MISKQRSKLFLDRHNFLKLCNQRQRGYWDEKRDKANSWTIIVLTHHLLEIGPTAGIMRLIMKIVRGSGILEAHMDARTVVAVAVSADLYRAH